MTTITLTPQEVRFIEAAATNEIDCYEKGSPEPNEDHLQIAITARSLLHRLSEAG